MIARPLGISQEWVNKIKLDAMKEGMLRAADVIRDREALLGKNNVKDLIREHYHMDAILTAAEQLTENDL